MFHLKPVVNAVLSGGVWGRASSDKALEADGAVVALRSAQLLNNPVLLRSTPKVCCRRAGESGQLEYASAPPTCCRVVPASSRNWRYLICEPCDGRSIRPAQLRR